MRKMKIKDYISIFRPVRWYQNIVVLLGMFLASTILNISLIEILPFLFLATLGVCLIASANYGINEIADLESDKHHPKKKNRAIPSGRVSPKKVFILSLIFYFFGLLLLKPLGTYLLFFFVTLWIINSILYNFKPIRLKDKPYIDFLSEALNNPLRILIGWYIVSKPEQIISSSFVLSFWFLGVFLMISKRFGEIRFIKDAKKIVAYRKSLRYYSEENLLIAMIAALGAFYYMFGALSMKHNIDYILVLPFIIIWTIWFFHISYENDTIVKDPERIFEKKKFLFYSLITLLMFMYLFISKTHLMIFIKQ